MKFLFKMLLILAGVLSVCAAIAAIEQGEFSYGIIFIIMIAVIYLLALAIFRFYHE